MTLRRVAAVAVLALGLMFTTTIPALAQTTPCGTGVNGKCTSDQVGPFMMGVSVGCGNLGDCTLVDISTVIANIGNWILGIVGSLVLLFYIWGGIQFLTSAGDSGRVKAGKESIKKATLGLVIVFVAFIAINTLKDSLLGSGGVGTGSTCTVGQVCALNSVCTEISPGAAVCVSKCEIQNISAGLGMGSQFTCGNPTNYEPGACTTNLCPDDETNQCCNVDARKP